MTDLDIIERLASVTGVGRINQAPQPKGHKMAWSWQVSVRSHREWLTVKVWPWLGQRRRSRVLELWPGVIGAVVAQREGHRSPKPA